MLFSSLCSCNLSHALLPGEKLIDTAVEVYLVPTSPILSRWTTTIDSRHARACRLLIKFHSQREAIQTEQVVTDL